MRQAIDIFTYGLTQLFGNFGAALRLTGLVWITTGLLVSATGYLMIGQPVGAIAIRPDAEGQMPELSATFTMVSFVLSLLAGAWISLIWSRFCLGADTPRGLVPSLRGLPFSGFLITLLLVVGLIGAVGLILYFAEFLIITRLPLLVTMIVIPLISAVIMLWLLLRFGAALPATAAGQVLSLAQAWSGSRDKAIWLLTILAVLVIAVLNFATVIVSSMPVPSYIAGIVSSWFIVMIGTGWLVAIFRSIPPAPK